MTLNRSRWAAVGAAVAVTLGAGGIGFVKAAENNASSVFVPITNCRIFDTRSTEDVGPRQTPLGADEEFVLEGHGETGDCNIPDTATALQLNVTAVNATETTHLTIFPSDADLPLASNLNPQLGHGTAYNAVTTRLSADGQFTVYNLLGEIDVLADATGYFVPADMAPEGVKSVVLAVDGADVADIDTTDTPVLSTPMTAPGAGTVVVEAVASVTGDATAVLECSISGDDVFDEASEQMVGADLTPSSLAVTTTIDVADAGDITAGLVCRTTGVGTATVHNPQLTLTFIPA